MRLAWSGVAAVCLLAQPLTALRAQTVPTLPADAPMPRPVVAFDPAQTQASFEVSLRVPMRAVGHFTRVSGQMQGDAGSGWTVLVQVDGSSLRFEGPAWMDRVTRSEQFLALDRHPEIRFASSAFTDSVLHAGGELRGELQLRGRRRPVTFQLLPADCARPGYDCDITVRGRISRHAFGMNTYRMSVRDEVDFRFRMRFLPPSAAVPAAQDSAA